MSLAKLTVFARSAAARGDETALLRARWVFDFARRVRDLAAPHAAQPAPDFLSVFWIRLHEVLAMLPESIETSVQVFESMPHEEVRSMEQTHGPALRVMRGHRSAVQAVLEARKLLSDDLHIFADWRRQVEVHLSQSAYAVQVRGKVGQARNLKEASLVRTLGRDVSIDERDASRGRVLASYRHDHGLVAQAIARAIVTPAAALRAAFASFEKEQRIG